MMKGPSLFSGGGQQRLERDGAINLAPSDGERGGGERIQVTSDGGGRW